MSIEVLGIIIAVIGLPAAIYGLYQLGLDFPGIFDSWFPGRHGVGGGVRGGKGGERGIFEFEVPHSRRSLGKMRLR
jgi:hypothetical protein